MATTPATIVDVVFDVEGRSLPADYAWPLLRALEARLPWLAHEAAAGVHPLRVATTTYGVVLLAQRARLTLRLPEARVDDSRALEGARLDVAGSALAVGAGRLRTLAPSATLAAQRVASTVVDLAAFEAEVARTLADRGIAAGIIAGGRRQGRAGDRDIAGFALSLHGLPPADSVRIQSEGIGGERRVGWGIFVPAKAIAAAEG